MERVEHGIVEVVDARVAYVAVVARSTNPFWPDAAIGHDDGDCYCEEESTEGKSALVHHPVHRRHRLQHRLW